MTRPSVYLAGPISGKSYAGATDWRGYAKGELGKMGIDGFSPMRGKQYLLGTLSIEDSYDEKVISTSRGIMHRDFHDVNVRDILLVNLLEAERVSIGTVMEMAWAYAAHKPVIAVMLDNGLHEHAMLRETITYRVKSLDEAFALAALVLLP